MSLTLDTLLQALFKTGSSSFTALLDTPDLTWSYKKIKELLKQSSISLQDLSACEHFLEDLKQDLSKLIPFTITLAVEPPQPFILQLSDWFKSNISSDLVLDIRVDATILGGLVLMGQGIYSDLSLVRKVDAFFEGIN